jgi:membrane associated rhomboid family serine protease
MFQLHVYPDGDKLLDEIVKDAAKLSIYSKAESKKFIKARFEKAYKRFATSVPKPLISELAYMGGSADVTRMVTSTFAHGSWEHLIGNLLGFIAFGLLVEGIIGSVMFAAVFVMLGLATAIFSSVWYSGETLANMFVGLSGVVFGMMGLLVYLWPQARIRTLLWVVIIFRRVSIPAWVLALFYVGWNVRYMLENVETNVNLIAHISGAALGYLLGLTMLRKNKKELLSLLAEQ